MDERRIEPPKRTMGWAGYKITPELLDTICSHLEVGAPVSVACAAAGIPKITYENWLRCLERGQTNQGLELTPEILEFGRRVELAKAKFQTDNLHLMRDIALGVKGKNWLPCAWVLERTQRETYALLPQGGTKVEVNVRSALADAERLLNEAQQKKPRGRPKKDATTDDQ